MTLYCAPDGLVHLRAEGGMATAWTRCEAATGDSRWFPNQLKKVPRDAVVTCLRCLAR